MPFPIPLQRIAEILEAPPANVAELWPHVEACLDSLGCGSDRAKIAALATIRVEDPKFQAARLEQYNGNPKVYFAKYDGRKDLGNVMPGDGFWYRGRGPSQITGRANYREMGRQLAVDLESDPDRACDPYTAAAIFAAFFFEKKIAADADAGRWGTCRRKWNGGMNGLDLFLHYVDALSAEIQKNQQGGAACASA